MKKNRQYENDFALYNRATIYRRVLCVRNEHLQRNEMKEKKAKLKTILSFGYAYDIRFITIETRAHTHEHRDKQISLFFFLQIS